MDKRKHVHLNCDGTISVDAEYYRDSMKAAAELVPKRPIDLAANAEEIFTLKDVLSKHVNKVIELQEDSKRLKALEKAMALELPMPHLLAVKMKADEIMLGDVVTSSQP